MSTTHARVTAQRTRSWGRWPRTAILAVVALLAAMIAVPSAAFAANPMLVSDRTDYSPGDTATLTGSDWVPGEVVHIVVNDDQSESWRLESGIADAAADPVVDASGGFTYAFTLPTWFVAKYTATATGPVSGSATTTFTDVAIGTYDQCANDDGDGYASGDTGCRWINGNLVKSQATYNESDATVQRLWLEGLSAGRHTLTLQYGTTQGGKHAYDFLTSWNHSEDWIAGADLCQDITGPCSLGGADQLDIPKDPLAPNQDDGKFTMSGADLVSATIPAIYSGDYTGNSETRITLAFDVPAPAAGQSSNVVLWFGAHVASQLDWGTGNGAASISGSPYHVALALLDDDAVGKRDNQMDSGAVQAPGTITVIKDAVPNDAQDFAFTLTDGVDSKTFVLDDDSDATKSNTETYQVRPGTWTVSETPVDGWGLTSIVCTPTQPVSTPTATVTVGTGGSVTCTFTNTKVVRQDLVVTKTAVPSYARDFDWTITKQVDKTRIDIADDQTADFTYTVIATPSAPSDSAWKVAGVITVTNPNSIPFSGVDVSDAITGGGVCTYGEPVENLTVPASGSVEIDYECTYAEQPPASVTNTATATWTAADYYGTDGNASGTASADFSAVAPSVTDGTVTVIDDKTDPAHPVTLGTVSYDDSLMDRTFGYTLGLAGVGGTCTDYTNTAKVLSDETVLDDASQTVKVCVGQDLTVSKTAEASHARLYKWTIDKSVDDDSVTVPSGSSHEFAYGVTVTPNGYTDSTWVLSGEITVSNPNDWEGIVADVTDLVDLGVGAVCTVTDGEDVTVPASGTATLFYSCTFDSQPNYAGTNTATATWDEAAYFTPTGSATGEAVVDVALGAETNKVIHVTDSLGGSLGSWNWADGAKTFSYKVAQAGVAGTCTTYDNTATITETGQTAQESVELCVAMDLNLSKDVSAAYTRTYDWLVSKSAADTRIEVKPGGTATFSYTVTATKNGFVDSGYSMYGTITVTNPNNFQDIVATVTDMPDVGGGAACSVMDGVDVIIPKSGAPVVLGFSCTFTGQPTYTGGANTARADWSQGTYSTPHGFVEGAATPVAFAVNEVNRTVDVYDDKTSGTPAKIGTADYVDGPFTFSYTLDKTGVPGTCVDFTNDAYLDLTVGTDPTASEDVTVCVGADLTVAKTVTASYDRTHRWLIDKKVAKDRINVPSGTNAIFDYTVEAKPDGITDSGWVMEGAITVTNPNTWQDVVVDLADVTDVGGGAVCVVDTANPLARIASVGLAVPADGSVTVPYACTFDSEPKYTGLNTATATWDADQAFTANGSASDTKDVTFALDQETNRTVDVYDDKTSDPQVFTKLGTADYYIGPFTFTYTLGAMGTTGTCNDFTNTAKVVSGATVLDDDTQTVTVCTGADLTVTKTATASHARLYKWLIDKSVVGPASVTVSAGTGHEFGYDVTVAPDGYTDSAWVVSGTITVSNPNDWEPITADVSDAVDLGGSPTCIVENNGEDVVVPAGQSLELSYSCTFETKPAYEGTNTATATWDAGAYFTPNGSASGEAAVSVALDETAQANRVITVTDSFNGGTPVVLGTADYYAGPFTFESSASPAGTAGTCTDYPNTATITETGQSDDASVELCVAKDLEVTKAVDASYTRTYDWLVSKSAADTRIEVKPSGTATFSYTVTATKNGFVDSGYAMTGTITVTNPNNFQDIVATVTDIPDVGGGAVCLVADGENVTIAAGGQETLGYGCSFTTQPEYTAGTNTARAAYATPPAAPHPFSDTVDSAPMPVTFAMNEVNDTVDVYDDKTVAEPPVLLGSVDWNAGPGPFEFKYSLNKTGFPADAGRCVDYTNTAYADLEVGTDPSASEDVTVCVGADLTVAKTVTASYDRTYQWLIDKSAKDPTIETKPGEKAVFDYTVIAKPNGYIDSGWVMTGEITVSNPNTWQDVVVDITDVTNVGGTCSVTGGTDVTVPKSGSVKVPYSCTFGAEPAYTGSNTATAAWDDAAAFTTNGSASGDKAVSFGLVGETNRTVKVFDDKTSATPVEIGVADYYGSLESRTFTYPLELEGVAGICKPFTNTAYVDLEVGTDPSASEDVTVCVGADLTVAKTVTASYDRTYQWLIDKSAKGPASTTTTAPTLTLPYSVTVTPNGFIDSGWVMTGEITVSNPNTWQDVVVDITDVTNVGGTCSVTGGTDVTVPKSGSVKVPYSCTFGAEPAYTGSNTATAAWDDAAAFTTNGSASGTQGVTFVLDQETNRVIHVVDDKAVPGGQVLNLTPPADYKDGVKSYDYRLTFTVPTNGCRSYTNTATITETGQKDTASVQVCGPPLTGARTMGFWQNKNGQAIITRYGSGLWTWLDRYAPLADVNSARNVLSVIKAADASGASMNAMLKGQMLATALDVYFSDPALGGNALLAPAPIGGLTVDISKWSGGFGGATSMTVSAMLAYASSQYVTGTKVTWYGNVKSVQEMAKNAFDAINNEKVLTMP